MGNQHSEMAPKTLILSWCLVSSLIGCVTAAADDAASVEQERLLRYETFIKQMEKYAHTRLRCKKHNRMVEYNPDYKYSPPGEGPNRMCNFNQSFFGCELKNENTILFTCPDCKEDPDYPKTAHDVCSECIDSNKKAFEDEKKYFESLDMDTLTVDEGCEIRFGAFRCSACLTTGAHKYFPGNYYMFNSKENDEHGQRNHLFADMGDNPGYDEDLGYCMSCHSEKRRPTWEAQDFSSDEPSWSEQNLQGQGEMIVRDDERSESGGLQDEDLGSSGDLPGLGSSSEGLPDLNSNSNSDSGNQESGDEGENTAPMERRRLVSTPFSRLRKALHV